MEETIALIKDGLVKEHFEFQTDFQTKELLLVNAREGYRYSICTLNQLPKKFGFSRTSGSDLGTMLASFLNNFTRIEEPDTEVQIQEIQLDELKKLIDERVAVALAKLAK